MKIIFTGGGTGGHFYPLIAIAEQLNIYLKENDASTEHRLYFMAPEPFDEKTLVEHGIEYRSIPAGKMRRYFSFLNISDTLKTILGFLKALWQLFLIYPDVVFAKGAYGSVPVLLAARILRIPVMIHESDSVPGRTNKWAGKFAERIALSYKEAAQYFPKEKVAHTGQPVRKQLKRKDNAEARNYFGLTDDAPALLILGGSQGAKSINTAIVNALPGLLNNYHIIHQTGKEKLAEVTEIASSITRNHPHGNRYKVYGNFTTEELAFAAGAASLVISRAGSTIFEIAQWGIPSIIVPIPDSNGDHQRKNAYAYALTGAASVIEEENLTANVLLSEVNRNLTDPERYRSMAQATQQFVHTDAAEIIAEELYRLSQSHE